MLTCLISTNQLIVMIKKLLGFVALFCLLLVGNKSSFAQSSTTAGDEFWLGFSINGLAGGAIPDLRLQITSKFVTNGLITSPAGLNQAFNVIPGTPTTVVLPGGTYQNSAPGAAQNIGIKITSQDYISVSAESVESASTDAARILPRQSIRSDYLVTTVDRTGALITNAFTQVLAVATEDNTQVEFVPTAATQSGRPAGVPFTVNLNEGQTYLIHSNSNLTGTTVRSTDPCKAIAVFVGASCAAVPPTATCCCDHLYEQAFPEKIWGKEYYTTGFRMEERVVILARDNNTSIVINGGPPVIRNRGQYITLAPAAPTPYHIIADKPIAVTEFAPSGSETTGDIGDPFQSRTFSLEQGVDTMSFSTIVGQNNNHRIEILCATSIVPSVTLDGVSISGGFVPHPQNPSFSYNNYNLGTSNIATSYVLGAAGPMVVMVHGFGPDDSYAFGGGGQTENLSIELTADRDTVCVGDTVWFDNEVSYVYLNHDYDFGDGNTTQANDPGHAWTTPGIYEVSLAVTEIACLDPDTVKMLIYVEAEKDTAIISGDRILCPGRSGFFFATHNEPDAIYNWDFDGGTVVSGTDAGPLEVTWPANGTYTVSLQVNNPNWICPAPDPDTFKVVVKRLVFPNAGPDIGTCSDQGNLMASLTTPTSTGQWLPTTGVLLSNANNPNSGFTITGGPGQYEMIWEETDLGCVSTDTMIIDYAIIPVPNAGPDQSVCGLEANVSATSIQGDGYWSSPDDVSFVPRTNTNSLATAATPGLKRVVWADTTTNGCESPDTLFLTFLDSLKPYAGMDDSICGTSVTLDADSASATQTGTWTANTGAFFSNPNDPKAQMFIPPFVGAQLVVEVYWTLDNGTCNDEDTVLITFFNLPAADAGVDDSTCGQTIGLNATPASGTGTGTWSATDGMGNAISATFLPSSNAPNATVSVNQFGEFYMVWTVDFGVCLTSDSVKIGFFQEPTPFAGQNDTTCNLNYNLTAAPSLGRGVWRSNDPGATFTDSNAVSTTANVNGFGVVEFYWHETNGACQTQDTVEINFFESAQIAVVADSVAFCGSNGNVSVSLNKPNQNGVWSSPTGLNFTTPNDSSSAINGPFGNHLAIYTIDYGACVVSDSIEVNLFDNPTTNAGADDTVCGSSTSLNASPSLGMGKWSAIGLGTFQDSTNPATIVDIGAGNFGAYCFVWTEVNGACTNSDTVCIDFRQQPVAVAGADQSLCDSTFNLSATASPNATGLWTSQPAGVVFANPSNANTSAHIPNNAYGTYNIIWGEQNTICTSTDTLVIDYFQQPAPTAGPIDTICGTTYTLQGALSTVGTGQWTATPAGITFTDATDPVTNISITGSGYGTYELVYTETNGTCVGSDTVLLTFMEQPAANAGTSTSVCALTYTLNATPTASATGEWTSAQTGAVFTNPNAANSSVTVNDYGVYDFTWTETNGPCTDADQIQISFEEQPDINVFVPDSICGTGFVLRTNHSVRGSILSLSNIPAGLTASPMNDSTWNMQLDPANPAYGCYTFDLSEDNFTCSDQESITLCFYESPNPDAGLDDGICGMVYQLQANQPIGNGNWSGPTGVVFSDAFSNTSTVDVSAIGFGTYTFVWEDQNQICTDQDSVTITFLDKPQVDCNCDLDTVYTTNPTFQFIDNTPGIVSWNWDFGDGNTSTEQNPSHDFYTFGVRDVTLTVADAFGCTSTYNCKIQIIDDIRFYCPNAFTPDGDGINDDFAPSIVGHLPGTFEMQIYDRWGELVFTSNDLEDEWLGYVKGSEKLADSGVYAVHITYQTFNQEEHTYQGMVVLVR